MKRKRSRVCPGSGSRVRPTGSSAFPEIKCSHCAAYLSPVKRYGDWQMRSHRPVRPDALDEVGT